MAAPVQHHEQTAVFSLTCPYCDLKSPSEQLLLKHVKITHSHDPDFKVQCNIGDCRRTFRNFRTYQNHVLRHEPVYIESELDEAMNDELYAEPDRENEYLEENEISENLQFNMKDMAAKWTLKIGESHCLTRTALLGIINDVTDIVQLIVGSIRDDVVQILASRSINSDVIDDIGEIFQCQDYNSPFNGLDTYHQQVVYYKEHFGLIVPERIVLRVHHIQRVSGRKRRTVEKTDEVIYIPILKTLEKLLENDAIRREVISGHQSLDSDILADYCDGTVFKTHPLFSKDLSALQLVLYYDDLEVCNPLGSRRKIHKIGAFYFMLGNLHPRYRSKVNGIQLIALAKTSIIENFGIDKVLERFVEDLKKLESGVSFNIKGQSYHFKGTISVASADNPASQLLGGFKQGHNAFRNCRRCLAVDSEIQSKFTDAELVLRTVEEHTRQCAKLEDDELYDHYSIAFGINRRSCLDDCHFFSVASGSLIPDIMHDLLEGVLPLETKLLLKALISKKIISVQTLKVVDQMNYLYMDKSDKPSPLSNVDLFSHDSSLKQHAMQMWTLGRFLPLAIGHLVPEDNGHWLNFTRLLEITDILFSRRLSSEDCGYLESLISDHHTCYRELYPDAKVTPKLHNMVHMPRLIMEYGPLISYWTARFEAKHRYFKHIAHVTGNFKNICFSLASRHQLFQCYLGLNTETLPGEKPEFGPNRTVKTPDCPVLHSPNAELPDWINSANWVRVNGILYQTPAVLVIGKDIENDDPIFGDLLNIFYFNDFIFFYVETLQYMFYSSHFHAHILSTNHTGSHFLIHCDNLLDYLPYGLYLPSFMSSTDNCRFVVSRRLFR